MFDIAFNDCVEHLVDGQAVLIGLVLAQFRRGGALDDALRNHRPAPITPAGQFLDKGFGKVLVKANPAAKTGREHVETQSPMATPDARLCLEKKKIITNII